MKILYDHQIFSYQKYGGISRYFFELMKYYHQSKECEFELGLNYSHNEYLQNADFIKLETSKPSIFDLQKESKLFKTYIDNKKVSSNRIKKCRFDLFIPTFYDPYFLNILENKPYCLTIFDMIPELYPEMYSKGIYSQIVSQRWIKAKKLLAQKANRVICISENTKKDVLRFYGVQENKIDVIYLANSLTEDHSKDFCGFIPEKYILFVGNRGKYKNFDFFLRAAKVILQKNTDIHIVCAGGGAFKKQEKDFINKLGITNQLFQYDINDSMLSALYKNALAFVFPSLYEGFGLPILEAFYSSCPAIISNTSCFPEIAEDAAEYFNPMDSNSIQDAIEKVIFNPERRKDLIDKELNRLKYFSWEKTARETLNVYRNIYI